jgi:hypothetical protein
MKPIFLLVILLPITLAGCRQRCSTCTKYAVTAYHIDTVPAGGQMVYDTSGGLVTQIPNSSYGTCKPPINTNSYPRFSLSPDSFTMCIDDAIR